MRTQSARAIWCRFAVRTLTDNLLNYLVDRDPAAYKRIRPLLDDLRSAELPYQAFWSRSEQRQVILVTTQLLMNPHLIELGLSNGTQLRVHNEWNEDCLATAGDAVVVTDAEGWLGLPRGGASLRVELSLGLTHGSTVHKRNFDVLSWGGLRVAPIN